VKLLGKYIKYKLKSKGKHQIHSPFVFDFITKCLKIKKNDSLKSQEKQLKSIYKKNHTSIEIADFGAGSKKLTNKRRISAIYKTAASKGIYANLLFQLVSYYNCKNSLELGTSLGIGTFNLAKGNESCDIQTIDACKNTQEIAKEKLNDFGIKNIKFINSEFDKAILSFEKEIKFDLIFIDGHHDGMALKRYLNLLDDFSHDETIFILDDIRWSEGMFAAWNEITKDKKYNLTLDLFRMGLIWKRQHQAKEHFVIKIKGILKGMI
jgi:predicted O-methyltransferase YrrM